MSGLDEPRAGIPFTVGDVFIFLFPGGALLASIAVIELWVRELGNSHDPALPLLDTLQHLYDALPEGAPAFSSALIAVILLAAAYTIGHLIAGFGVILIERVFVFKGIGWPYRLLLGLRERESRWTRTSRSFYRGLFVWCNFTLLLLYIGLAYCPSGPGRIVAVLIPLALAACLLFSIVNKFAASARRRALCRAIRDFRERVFEYSRPGKKELKWSREQLLSRIHRLMSTRQMISSLLAKPWDGGLNWLVRIYGTRTPMSLSFRKDVLDRFKSLEVSPGEIDSLSFWLAYLYVLERSRTLGSVVLDLRRQYRFIRNLGAAFFASFCWSFYWLWQTGVLESLPSNSSTQATLLRALPVLAFVTASLCLVRYFFLFFTVFSKLVFRSFVIVAGEWRRVSNDQATQVAPRWTGA